jgi:hypothetical protein
MTTPAESPADSPLAGAPAAPAAPVAASAPAPAAKDKPEAAADSKPAPAAKDEPEAADSKPAPAAAAAPTAAAEDAPPAADAPAADSKDAKTTDITAGPGGVMTDEVGVITGDLTLRSELAGTKLTLRVQYKEADEWYVVTGGKATLKNPADLDAVHKIVVGILNRPEG